MADLPTPGIPSLQLLLIQPDRALGASLSLALDEIGHTVTMVDRISAGTLGWVDDFIDLVILDLDEVGPEVKFFCGASRGRWLSAPVALTPHLPRSCVRCTSPACC